jgi:predicted DNA-binding protein
MSYDSQTGTRLTNNLSTTALTPYPQPSRIGVVASARIVLILPDELVKPLNGLAKRKGLSRASYIRMALTEHVETESEPSLAQALRSPRALAQYIRTSAAGEEGAQPKA